LRCKRGRADRRKRALRARQTRPAPAQTHELMSAVAAIEAAAYKLSAATARLEAVVAQLAAAARQLVTPAPAKPSARPRPRHGCCKRAARSGSYYTLRPTIVARRTARRWLLPEA
jgi:hypothetical protein